jgi:hypothetical protein
MVMSEWDDKEYGDLRNRRTTHGKRPNQRKLTVVIVDGDQVAELQVTAVGQGEGQSSSSKVRRTKAREKKVATYPAVEAASEATPS